MHFQALCQVGKGLVGPLPETLRDNNKYLYSDVYYLSKWAEAAPLPNC